LKRRNFIQTIAALTGIGYVLPGCKPKHAIGGKIVGASASVGHLLRDKNFGNPEIIEQKDIVIIGGGVSGLSAARHLHKNGLHNFVVLDLEEKMGGNAASGNNTISGYPWGAHYIPVPNNNLKDYIGFLQDCGVVTAINENGLPVYNELYLCFDPQERLYINGKWQEGLIPQYGVPDKELAQIKRFLEKMHFYREAKGEDGKEAFAIPVNDSSSDEKYKVLDNITMRQWLLQNDYTSPYLHWYINYCTRDDFGTNYDVASGWAGIHYFASRKGKGVNAEYSDVLTWPQGNGWLVQHLQSEIKDQLQSNSLVVRVSKTDAGLEIDYYQVQQKKLQRIIAKQCIMAVPQFIAARMLNDTERMRTVHQHLDYTPWMVANFSVGNLKERSGAPASWDNVLYGSKSLGYVVATHELLQQQIPQKNLTYYLPLTDNEPLAERKMAQQRSHAEWVEIIMADLQTVHPEIREAVTEINIMIWGHAMARPLPGLVYGPVRKQLAISVEDCIHFAHTDLAGISIFEEAFYQGLNAAKNIITQLAV
jgi:predicted NAD/FAD-binding protein